MATLESALQYADDVLSGAVVAGKWVKLACERFLKDLERHPFDVEKAKRVLDFYPDFIRHVKGKLAGQPYELSDWEAFILINIFGFVDDKGNRRFKWAYIEVARKNSKSTFCSGIALYMTAFDMEGGAEVYSAATTRDQARIVFGDAQNMVRKSPPLKKVFGVHKLNIHHMKSASKFEPLSSDAQTLDGLNIHCAIMDEVHAHKTREVWDVVETALSAREQPLMLAITTAGFNKQGIGYEQRGYVTKLLEKTAEPNEAYFGIIFSIDEDDDPFDESNWIKANPNLGRSKRLADMQDLAKKAKEMPAARNNFLTKHLNVWVNAETAWLDMVKWEKLPERGSIEHLKTLPCYIGMDLANKLDVAAVVAAFPDGNNIHFLCKFYLPENTIFAKSRTIGNMYDTWAKQGYLTLTDGDIIDHEYIEQDIREWLTQFDVKAVGFDPWGSTQMSIRLSEEGAPMVEIPQTVKNLSESMKEIEAKVISGELHKDKNPMMDWMASNIVVKLDRNENYFPNKEHADNKIDGMVALFMAVNRILTDDGISLDDFLSDSITIEGF